MPNALESNKKQTGAWESFNASLLQQAWEFVRDILVLWVRDGVLVFSTSQLHCSMATAGSLCVSMCVSGRGREEEEIIFSYRNVRD